MKKNVVFKNLFFYWMIILSLFSFLACEKIEETDAILLENELLEKSTLPACLPGLPYIFVNTTSDIIDFAGSQLVADLPGPDGLISLHEAMIAAENTSGSQYIGFNIPVNDIGFNGRVFTIKPTAPLPELLNNGTTINGGTQTLFTGNTNPFGPEIVLDGSLAGGTAGISVRSDSNTFLNLVIHSFEFTGIQFNTDMLNLHPMHVKISGCYIGTDETGSIALGNGWEGIAINGRDNIIGGQHRSDGNLISGNLTVTCRAEILVGGSGTLIQHNTIGTDRTGTVSLGRADGIFIENTNNTIIRENLISGNAGSAISINGNNTTRNTVSRNSIFSNGNLAIDLNSDGITPNDFGDSDIGPNNLMNFPILTSAKIVPGKLIVNGTIDTPNPKKTAIEFFANPLPNPGGDPSGYGEGAIFLGVIRPNPNGKFTANLPSVAPGTLISATATDAAGNTSEFSANITAKKSGQK